MVPFEVFFLNHILILKQPLILFDSVVNWPLLKASLDVVRNHPKKWLFWARFISLRKMKLNGFNIHDSDFGGVFPKPPPNGKTASNSAFSGRNQSPLKVDFIVMEIEIKNVNPSDVMELYQEIGDDLAHTLDDQESENSRLK